MRLFTTALCLGLLALTGCRTTALSDDERAGIPDGAAAVVLTSDLSAGELYAAAREHLRKMGFILADTPGDRYVLVTEDMGVGQTMTELRLVAVVEKRRFRKPRLVLSGEYEFPPYGFKRARNKESARNRDAMAFEEIIVIAQELPHTRVDFWTEKELERTGFGDRGSLL